MTKDEFIEWMLYIMKRSPARDSGEVTYEYLREHMARLLVQEPDERKVALDALRSWLALRREPESMAAAMLAAGLGFIELREDLHRLLEDIEAGRSNFNPRMKAYYAERAHNYLTALYNIVPE
ncbi:hypothetical protein [Nitrospira tepida]|uniref:hypothetical protein n=1 Tax=Nitrospira tepida TaxID=2973512 RepID=UPI00259CEC22|nr:hypothetical protein [Nitrospira tepida]